MRGEHHERVFALTDEVTQFILGAQRKTRVVEDGFHVNGVILHGIGRIEVALHFALNEFGENGIIHRTI